MREVADGFVDELLAGVARALQIHLNLKQFVDDKVSSFFDVNISYNPNSSRRADSYPGNGEPSKY